MKERKVYRPTPILKGEDAIEFLEELERNVKETRLKKVELKFGGLK